MNPNTQSRGRLRHSLLCRGWWVVVVCCLAVHATALARDLDHASPGSVGISADRLERIDAAMQLEIDADRKAGMAVLIARDGKIVYEKAFGYADMDSKRPMRTDSYFRVYSMTKPIVSVALLMLYEEGKFQLTDPLSKYIPAMKDVKVFAGEDEDGKMILEEPNRPITIRDVFRHTAGFSYGVLLGGEPNNPVEAAYAEAGIAYDKLDSPRELAEDKLPTVPLLFHPGEKWQYSFAHDVQAYLVEHFSGMSIDEFLQRRIFEPLGMKDSFFGEPAEDGPRVTTVYMVDQDGKLQELAEPLGFPHARFGEHPFGGAGLTMTLADYAKFAQMLLNGGELNGTRILGKKTVELMRTNHLPPGVTMDFPGQGYGLGVGVVIDTAASGNLGSVGQFGWGGAATTWVTIDPEEDMVSLVFAQQMFDLEFIMRSHTLVYQAIAE